MALQIEVAKVSASINEDGIYTISANLTCWPEGVVKEYPTAEDTKNAVIFQNFSQNHNPANAISVARDVLLSKMQTVIDQYKQSRAVFNSSQLDTAISYIESNLEG